MYSTRPESTRLYPWKFSTLAHHLSLDDFTSAWPIHPFKVTMLHVTCYLISQLANQDADFQDDPKILMEINLRIY